MSRCVFTIAFAMLYYLLTNVWCILDVEEFENGLYVAVPSFN